MSDKNLGEMKENLEKEIDGIIYDGRNEGFYFEEENAKHLQELQDTMLYIFEEEERNIEVLEQVVSTVKYHSEVRSKLITKLKDKSHNSWILETERLPEKKGHYLVTSEMNYYHGGSLDKNKDGTTKSIAVAYYDGTDKIGGKNYWNKSHVTAWRQLPDLC